MKHIVIVFAVLVTAGGVRAQTARQTQSRAEQAVIAVEKAYWDAVRNCDQKTWDRLTSEDFMYITAPGSIKDKELSRIDTFEFEGSCEHKNYEVEPVVVRIFGDTAVSIGNFGLRPGANNQRTWLVYTR